MNVNDCKQSILNMCRVNNVFSEACLNKLDEMGFFKAPASTKYHGAYEGGLAEHSYNVAVMLELLTKELSLSWEEPTSPIRVGILHDLCKVDQYVLGEDGKSWAYNQNTLLNDHGVKSVILAQQLPDVHLTMEEIACITYHMGAFVDSKQWNNYTNAIHQYPNVLWTHTADCFAAHVVEIQEDNK